MRTLLLLNVFAPEELGSRIQKARNEAGFTQPELAEILGLSLRQVQNLESGASKPYKHIRDIAEATGKSVEWLLHGEGPIRDEDRFREILQEELAAMRADLAADLASTFEAWESRLEGVVRGPGTTQPARARKR